MSLNLWAEISADPTIFGNAFHKMSWLEMCVAFSTNAHHPWNLLSLTSKVSTEDIADWMMAWFTITDARRLASLTTYLACSTGVASGQCKVMLGLCKWLLWHLWCELPLNEPSDWKIFYHGSLCDHVTYLSKCHSVMCICSILGHFISVVCEFELSVLMTAESYFRCSVRTIFTMLKSVPYIWLCDLWSS